MSIITKGKRRSRTKRSKRKAGGLPGEVEAALARERTPESKPACPPLSEYIEYAKEVFQVPEWTKRTLTGKEHSEVAAKAVKDFGIEADEIESIVESSYGFIVPTSNLLNFTPSDPSITYGYESIYYKRKGSLNFNRVEMLRELWGHRGGAQKYVPLLDDPDREVYRTCENCGKVLYADSFDCVSHLCITEEDIGYTPEDKQFQADEARRENKALKQHGTSARNHSQYSDFEKKLFVYDLGRFEDKDIYDWMEDQVRRQNTYGMGLISPEGKKITAQNGRWCNVKGSRSRHLYKVLKDAIGEIPDCILLTLTTHEPEVESFMPDNTNLLPVQYATIYVGKWITRFMKDLRQYQKSRGISWAFVAWVLEFQKNGYPHIHIIFKGKWLGNIREIAKLWPYCEPQGVDYMDKRKYEQRLMREGRLKPGRHVGGIRLVNYLCGYASKMSQTLTEDGVHKGYAWLAFFGGRMYNVAREYKKEKDPEKKKDWKCEGLKVII
jgi:hypothetical protein